MAISLPLALAQMRTVTKTAMTIYSGTTPVSGYLFFYAQMNDEVLPISMTVAVDGNPPAILWRGEVMGIDQAKKISVVQTAGTSELPLGIALFYDSGTSAVI